MRATPGPPGGVSQDGSPGKPDLVGDQASARGGVVRVSLRGDRVVLSSRAATVATGELRAEETGG